MSFTLRERKSLNPQEMSWRYPGSKSTQNSFILCPSSQPHSTQCKSPSAHRNSELRAVRNIKSIPLINVIMLGNISAWKILSIRYLLICVPSGRIQTLHVPRVSRAIGSNSCPLNKVRYIFQLQVDADAYGACLVCFKMCLLLLPNGNRRTRADLAGLAFQLEKWLCLL